MAVGCAGIVSDVCQLAIRGKAAHFDETKESLDMDIAGEEPSFVDLLHVSNPRPLVGSALYLKLRCKGYPLPYVAFFHNSQLIRHDERHRICRKSTDCFIFL